MGLVAGLKPGDPREIGPYRLLGQLGAGGMGQVFLGMSAGGRPIAVKVIRDELADDPEFRTRFRREVAAARKVSGLFTAIVVDADLDGPVPWLATAYVAGPSLAEAVREHGPLPVRTLLALAAGLAEGVSAIHAAGVVHRDLKPSNVLLAEDGPRVIDFGISEAAEAVALTGANVVIGSPGFMSPEQVLGHEIGPPSDMFSLGAVLTFAGSGQGPFGSGSNAALVYRLVNSPASLGRLPGEVRQLIGSCLAKHPNDRPTAAELLAVVGAIQPARGWLAESIIYGFSGSQSAADLIGAATGGNVLKFAAPAAGEQELGGGGARHARHRFARPLASAGITGGLVAASALAVFALTGAVRTPMAPQAQPEVGASQTTPAAAPASPGTVTPGPSSSARPVTPAPAAYLSPSLSEFLSPSGAATVSPARSASASNSAAPAAAPSGSSSASASPSASPSPSASDSSSASASPSTSDSASPTPTDSASPTPTPTESASLSPAPSDSSSAPSSDPATSAPSASSS
jgi:serine/threonine protein kinase